jgi:hypothetical protein
MATGGGLLDLVARGKKDTFFTQNPKISFFHSVYPRYPAFTQEIRLTQPRNNAEWGRWVDFEIEPVGDIMRNPVLLIDLPTWLPTAEAKINRTSYITDPLGVEFGYTQDIGAMMIEKVQFYNDQLLLHEFWGQWLQWRTGMQSNASVYGALAGRRRLGTGTLARGATPNRLRVTLPLLGNQHQDDPGFPLTAVSAQRFRIRIYLKRLEDVIEASDGRLHPQPWDTDFVCNTSDTESYIFRTLPRSKVGGPILTLETTQVYVPRDVQEYLRKTALYVPFVQCQQSRFTIESNRFFPIVNNNSVVSIPLPLDFIGAVSRLTVGVQSDADIQAGQLYKLEPPSGGATTYLNTLRLNLGLVDRMFEFPVSVWRDVVNYYKNDREPREPNGGVLNAYTMSFGGRDETRPIGTFNMSRTMEAVLYVTLAAIEADPRTDSRKCYITVYGEAWNVFHIKDLRGMAMFAD